MWRVPRIWEGGECWVIGGGTSIVQQFKIPTDIIQQVRDKQTSISVFSPYLSYLHDKHVIGVNSALFLGNWIDVLVFGDYGFYSRHIQCINNFPGIKIFTSNKGKNSEFIQAGIKFLGRNNEKTYGLTNNIQKISWNANSGAAAINVAVHFGVKKIYLLGFDMFLTEHNQHWHNQYRTEQIEKERSNKGVKLPFNRHLKGFSLIKKDADKLGVEIINVSPNSKIKEFPKTSMEDILCKD